MTDEKVMVCGYPLREAPIEVLVLAIDRAMIDSCSHQFPKPEDAQLLGAEVRRRLERLAALEKVDEEAALRAENAALRERLHHPCDGCPGCSSNDCPDALDVAQIDLVVWRHEAERLRTRNVVVEDTLRQLLAGCVEFFGKRDCPAYMAVLIQNGKGTLAAAKPADNGAGSTLRKTKDQTP